MLISELIRALDLLGTVHLSKDKSKPDAAILKVRELISDGAGVTLSSWIERQQLPPAPAPKKKGKVKIDDSQVTKIIQSLNQSGVDEPSFDRLIDELDKQGLTSNSWQRLCMEYTGSKASSGTVARRSILEHFAASVRLAKRRGMLQKGE